ncbi:hypothetical protein Agabi119p4_406 [Agaricus bisporus var. burnettii]|uniref:Uncharacterized protein n=1 Tax=Agaricus bisporus var. burnettii TaxID=192524 RepID=A0A8H7KKW9_AGABI|nr:hypothetical protein Agabi119p4_406 [Agaricus bisporus var. burnettii]
MTLDKSTQNGTPDPAIQLTSSKQDLLELASSLAQRADDLPDTSMPLVAELAESIAVTDNIAKGVEERLDAIIENLDSLLSALEEDSENQQHIQPSAVGNGEGDKQSSN